jgi:hypothetical protein
MLTNEQIQNNINKLNIDLVLIKTDNDIEIIKLYDILKKFEIFNKKYLASEKYNCIFLNDYGNWIQFEISRASYEFVNDGSINNFCHRYIIFDMMYQENEIKIFFNNIFLPKIPSYEPRKIIKSLD